MIISVAATKVDASGNRRRVLALYDVCVAFFHADSDGTIAVIPPEGCAEVGIVWFLLKAMYGTRPASKLFGSYVTDNMQKEGFQLLAIMPMTFYHPVLDICMGCHGDDFLAEGTAASCDELDKIMHRCFEVKIMPRIGPPEHGGQATSGRHLGRLIKWSPKGFTWEGNEKHLVDLFEATGLKEGSKGVDSPRVQGHRQRLP